MTISKFHTSFEPKNASEDSIYKSRLAQLVLYFVVVVIQPRVITSYEKKIRKKHEIEFPIREKKGEKIEFVKL